MRAWLVVSGSLDHADNHSTTQQVNWYRATPLYIPKFGSKLSFFTMLVGEAQAFGKTIIKCRRARLRAWSVVGGSLDHPDNHSTTHQVNWYRATPLFIPKFGSKLSFF